MPKITTYTEKVTLDDDDVFIIVDKVTSLNRKVKWSTIASAVLSLLSDTLNLSDRAIYNVSVSTISIPDDSLSARTLILTADLYDETKPYAIIDVVRSDGTHGGVAGKCYKSLANVNTGNDLNDATKWAFADATGGNVGNLEISTFGNPSTLPADHMIKFKANPISVKFVATPVATISEGELALDGNTDVSLESTIAYLTLLNEGGMSVKQASGLIT